MKKLLGLALSITIFSLTPAVGKAYDMTDVEIEHFGAMVGSLVGGCEKKLKGMLGKKKWKKFENVVGPLFKKYEKHNLFVKNEKKSKAEARESAFASAILCVNGYNWINGFMLGLNVK